MHPRLVALADRVLPAAIAGRLRTWRTARAERRYLRRTVEHRYGGQRFRVTIGSPYGERYDGDWAELPEIAVLRRHGLRPGARVFNLGANHGVIALMLADAVGSDGRVVALEADPNLAAIAARNAADNGLHWLECRHAAVAARSGEVRFGVDGRVADAGGRFGARPVPAVAIDDLADRYGPPDVVFMDVEGYEAQALAGAARTLARGADWFVEVHGDQALSIYGARNQDVVGFFDPSRYELLAGRGWLGWLPSGEIGESTSFAVLPPGQPPPDERFFLLALRRDPGA